MRHSNLRLAVLLVALASLGLAPVPKARPSPAKEDLKKLQGTWVRVSLSFDGSRAR